MRRGELERLLDPLSPRAFFQKSWGKKPIHVKGRPGKLDHFRFDRASFWGAVGALPDDATCLRSIYYDSAGKHQELLQLSPRLAPALFESGMTIVFTNLEDHYRPIRDLVDSLRADLDLPGHITVGCFFSPHQHGAGLHYDNHHAIVLQIEGKKLWRVSREPALEFPPENYGYEGDAAILERNARSPALTTKLPVRKDFLEVELEPGDILYMPPGTWHEPRATGGGASLALTLGPFVKTALQLVSEQLARGLGDRLEWRRSVPVGPRTGSFPEEFFAARLADLREYVAHLKPADLARSWHQHVATPVRAAVSRIEVGPKDRLSVDRSRRVSVLAGGEKVYLYLDGEEIDLPASASPFVEGLLASDSFVASDAQGWVGPKDEPYDWEDVKQILEVLTSRGFLRFSEGPASRAKPKRAARRAR